MDLDKYNKAIKDYEIGLTLRKAAEKNNVHRYTLSNMIKDKGLFRCQEDKYKKAHQYYVENNTTVTEIAKIFKLHKATFSKYLKKQGINAKYKYNYDRRYFQNINTEEKAYWVGFLAADGWVSCREVIIHLSLKDKSHLDKFSNIFGVPCKQGESFDKRTKKIYKYCRTGLYGKELCIDLKNLGMDGNKSESLTGDILNRIPKESLHHFIRGYFDGDGCVRFSLIDNRKEFAVDIAGTQDFLTALKKHMIYSLNLSNVQIRKDKGVFRLAWGGNLQVRRIKEYLYQDSTIYLERKKEKFDLLNL